MNDKDWNRINEQIQTIIEWTRKIKHQEWSGKARWKVKIEK